MSVDGTNPLLSLVSCTCVRACGSFFITGLCGSSLGGLVEGAHDVFIAVDVELVLIGEGDLRAAILGQQHRIAHLHGDRLHGSVLSPAAGTHSHDGALVELFALGGGGEDDAGLGLGLRDDLLDHDAVRQRLERLEREHSLFLVV